MTTIKKCQLSALLLFLIITFGISQNTQIADKINPSKKYSFWAYDKEKLLGSGSLYSAHDDNIVLVNKSKGQQPINIVDIKIIKIRKKNKVGLGILLGTLGGITAGALIGAASYKKPPPCDPKQIFCFELFDKKINAIVGGVLGIIPGAIVGGVIGSFKINIPINYDRNKYKEVQSKLKSISLEK
jgi:hypothetical protein